MDRATELLNYSIQNRKNKKFVTDINSRSQSYSDSESIIKPRTQSNRYKHKHDLKINNRSKETIRRTFKFLTETQSSSSLSSPLQQDQSSSLKRRGCSLVHQNSSSSKKIKVNEEQLNIEQAGKQFSIQIQKTKNPKEKNQK